VHRAPSTLALILAALIEQGLRLAIRPPQPIERGSRISLPVSRPRFGLIAGIDLDDSANLLDQMDGIG